jgi:phospholipid/cholesterol/gamma-HCH transport system ATP-binding protein
MPVRQGVLRRQARVREILHTLPPAAQEAIREDLVRTEAESARIYAQNAVPEYGN